MKPELIDAAGAQRDGDFPGGHAGASLKRPVFSAIGPTLRPNFPGGHAGASLKRGDGRPRADGGRDFPGGHAGASLKPVQRDDGDRDVAGFPRRTRRGLIEAVRRRGGRWRPP